MFIRPSTFRVSDHHLDAKSITHTEPSLARPFKVISIQFAFFLSLSPWRKLQKERGMKYWLSVSATRALKLVCTADLIWWELLSSTTYVELISADPTCWGIHIVFVHCSGTFGPRCEEALGEFKCCHSCFLDFRDVSPLIHSLEGHVLAVYVRTYVSTGTYCDSTLWNWWNTGIPKIVR